MRIWENMEHGLFWDSEWFRASLLLCIWVAPGEQAKMVEQYRALRHLQFCFGFVCLFFACFVFLRQVSLCYSSCPQTPGLNIQLPLSNLKEWGVGRITHSLSKYLMSICCVISLVLGTENRAMNKRIDSCS